MGLNDKPQLNMQVYLCTLNVDNPWYYDQTATVPIPNFCVPAYHQDLREKW